MDQRQQRMANLQELMDEAERAMLEDGMKDTLLFNWLVNFGRTKWNVSERTGRDYAVTVFLKLESIYGGLSASLNDMQERRTEKSTSSSKESMASQGRGS